MRMTRPQTRPPLLFGLDHLRMKDPLAQNRPGVEKWNPPPGPPLLSALYRQTITLHRPYPTTPHYHGEVGTPKKPIPLQDQGWEPLTNQKYHPLYQPLLGLMWENYSISLPAQIQRMNLRKTWKFATTPIRTAHLIRKDIHLFLEKIYFPEYLLQNTYTQPKGKEYRFALKSFKEGWAPVPSLYSANL